MTNATLARRWMEEVWNERKTDLVHALVRPDSVCHTPVGDLVGPAPFLAFHAQLLQAVPDLRVAVEDLLADGDRVAVRWSAAGTHAGPFEGRPPTGRRVAFHGVTWTRYADGTMAEGWDCWDVTGLLRQLRGDSA